MDCKNDQKKGKPKARATGDWGVVSEQCRDNLYGFNGVVVFGEETYDMTPGCIPDMAGYHQYLTRRGNGFIAEIIHADQQNNAWASRQMLPVNGAVTVSAMNPRNQLEYRHMDPPFTGGYASQPVYRGGGNGSQLWDRDELHDEDERNLHRKEKKKKKKKKKKAGSRRRK